MSDGEIVQLIDEEFINECKALLVETEFNSRWALVEGYHGLGKLILERANPTLELTKEVEESNLTRIVQALAVELKKAERLLWYAVKFYRMFPELERVPEGKNTSWNTIMRKYLTVSPTPCEHPDNERKVITIEVCQSCGKRVDNIKKSE